MTHYSKGAEKPPLPKDRLRLYSMRFCPFAQRVRLVLAAKGIQYECININLKDRPDWYFDINPNGTVPALEHPDGRHLFESLICCEYLEDASSEGRSLHPEDPFERNQQRLLVDIYGKKVIPNYYKLIKQKDDVTYQEFTKQIKVYDGKLAERKSDFFGGEKPGMMDYLIWPWLEKLPVLEELTGFDLSKGFPALHNWCASMREDKAVKECAYPSEWYKEFLPGYFSGKEESQLIGIDIKS